MEAEGGLSTNGKVSTEIRKWTLNGAQQSEQVRRQRRESGQRTTDGRREWSRSESCVRISEWYLTERVNIRTAVKEICELVSVREV